MTYEIKADHVDTYVVNQKHKCSDLHHGFMLTDPSRPLKMQPGEVVLFPHVCSFCKHEDYFPERFPAIRYIDHGATFNVAGFVMSEQKV
jgi:hypothetical protein